jgi:hypothetical protein
MHKLFVGGLNSITTEGGYLINLIKSFYFIESMKEYFH